MAETESNVSVGFQNSERFVNFGHRSITCSTPLSVKLWGKVCAGCTVDIHDASNEHVHLISFSIAWVLGAVVEIDTRQVREHRQELCSGGQ